MKIGLRVDVDTFRGTRDGVPALCRVLDKYAIQGTFYVSVGPDNMGRNLWRLLRPTFLRKMLRSKAASLYGWDILLRGTFGPGPRIGKRLGHVIRAASEAGHELGFHAWDHYGWQAHIDKMAPPAIRASIQQGVTQLSEITGKPVSSSAAPGWRCNDQVLTVKESFDFSYNSDCRGRRIFYPVVNGERLRHPQVPVTLPTYDEVVGQSDVTDRNYNDHMLGMLKPQALNVLTIHAEVEGILHREMFDAFVRAALERGWSFVPLRDLLPLQSEIPDGHMRQKEIPGREGWVAVEEA